MSDTKNVKQMETGNKTVLILNEMLIRCTDQEERGALETALKAVNKDIKRPLCFVYDGLGGTPHVCPNCGGALYDSDWYDLTKSKYHHNRCVYCGQHLDWYAEITEEYKGKTAYTRPW